MSVFPIQIRVGDRLTDADGEWEVVSGPYLQGGNTAQARVQRPGLATTKREVAWSAYKKLTVRRAGDRPKLA